MAGVVALGLGLGSSIVSGIQTADANGQAKKTQDQEVQLLNEARHQTEIQQEQKGLITVRNAQESALNPPNQKFTANNTIRTGPLGLEPSPKSGAPTALLGT